MMFRPKSKAALTLQIKQATPDAAAPLKTDKTKKVMPTDTKSAVPNNKKTID